MRRHLARVARRARSEFADYLVGGESIVRWAESRHGTWVFLLWDTRHSPVSRRFALQELLRRVSPHGLGSVNLLFGGGGSGTRADYHCLEHGMGVRRVR